MLNGKLLRILLISALSFSIFQQDTSVYANPKGQMTNKDVVILLASPILSYAMCYGFYLLGDYLKQLLMSDNSYPYHYSPWSSEKERLNAYLLNFDELSKIWSEENLDLTKFQSEAKKHQDLFENDHSKEDIRIPHISHHVWFTDPENPFELKWVEQNILRRKIAVLNNRNGQWRSILWTNTISGIPKTVELAKSLGMEVRSLEDLPNPFAEIIPKMIEKGSYYRVMATDIWRVEVIRSLGGFYSDNDYELDKNIDNLTRTYDSFFGFQDHKQSSAGNSILAARAHHPIMEAYHELLYRNILGDKDQIPNSIKNPKSPFLKVITTTGPHALTMSIARGMNTDGFRDVVLQHGIVFYLPEESFYGSIRDLHNTRGIGNDHYSGSWMDESSFQMTRRFHSTLGKTVGEELLNY